MRCWGHGPMSTSSLSTPPLGGGEPDGRPCRGLLFAQQGPDSLEPWQEAQSVDGEAEGIGRRGLHGGFVTVPPTEQLARFGGTVGYDASSLGLTHRGCGGKIGRASCGEGEWHDGEVWGDHE